MTGLFRQYNYNYVVLVTNLIIISDLLLPNRPSNIQLLFFASHDTVFPHCLMSHDCHTHVQNENPLYRSAAKDYANPMYGK